MFNSRQPVLGIDFGGVISQGHTTDELMPGVVDSVAALSYHIFLERVCIVSRVDNVESVERVLKYMEDRQLWSRMRIPKGNIRFCLRRQDKAPICEDLGVTHFVDDHTEVLLAMNSVPNKYALGTKAEELVAFPPFGIHVCSDWYEITEKIRL